MYRSPILDCRLVIHSEVLQQITDRAMRSTIRMPQSLTPNAPLRRNIAALLDLRGNMVPWSYFAFATG